MKRSEIVMAIAAALALGQFLIRPLLADTGYSAATRIERGQAETPLQVNVGQTATSIVTAHIRRPDLAIVNNSANTLWLGGDNTVTIGNGFPVFSSSTWKDDAYTGPLFGFCGGSNCDVRVWQGTVPGSASIP